MKTEIQLYNFIKSPLLYLEVVRLLERDSGANFISIRKKKSGKNIKTIKDYVSRLESDASQQTGKVTVLIAADTEAAVYDVFLNHGFEPVEGKLSENGEERSDIGIKVLGSDGKVKVIHFEIKATQTKDAFQGATHGLKKVSRYLLFNFTVDMDYVLPDVDSPNCHSLPGLITHAYCAFHDGKLEWKGEASKTNSRSTAKIPGSVSKKVHCVALGQIEKMSRSICRTPKAGRTVGKQWIRVNAVLHRQPLSKYRNKQNILEG